MECKHNEVITVNCYCQLEIDSEPYENGVSEKPTEKDEELVAYTEIQMGVNICRSCKKVIVYLDDDIEIGNKIA